MLIYLKTDFFYYVFKFMKKNQPKTFSSIYNFIDIEYNNILLITKAF